ncbi:MAG: hypothetical protein ABR915_19690 [Thermoguttaceae bacterium]
MNADDRGIYAFAGRHSDTDGGLWWWQLDMAGQVLHHGRVGSDDLKPAPDSSAPKISTGMNSIAVMDGDRFLMPRLYFQRTDQGFAPYKPNLAAAALVPGNQGLLNRLGFMNGYKLNSYSGTLAKMYAVHGADFVMVGGATSIGGRGGSGDSVLRRMKGGEKKAEVVWENETGLGGKVNTRISALAVADDAVVIGMDQHLQLLNLADGKLRQELPLAAKAIQGGIAVAAGRVTVVAGDGTVACFAAAE